MPCPRITSPIEKARSPSSDGRAPASRPVRLDAFFLISRVTARGGPPRGQFHMRVAREHEEELPRARRWLCGPLASHRLSYAQAAPTNLAERLAWLLLLGFKSSP